MNYKNLLIASSTILLFLYMAVALVWSRVRAREQLCTGLENGRVEVVSHPGDVSGFVTSDELTRELGSLTQRLQTIRLSDVDLDSVSQVLNGLDKIEYATVSRLNNHQVRVRVHPMQPVARVWDYRSRPRTYYVNREGKSISADARYHLDVPQIVGNFDSDHPVSGLMPLLEYMDEHPEWHALVSQINYDRSNGVVSLVPATRGIVIEFGDMTDVANKFDRLAVFIRDVLPHRGWEYYNKLSVRWPGQVVATRRQQRLSIPTVIDSGDDDNLTPASAETT